MGGNGDWILTRECFGFNFALGLALKGCNWIVVPRENDSKWRRQQRTAIDLFSILHSYLVVLVMA